MLITSGMFCDRNELITDEFGQQPFYVKLLKIFIIVNGFKYSFFACLFFGDGANIASGFAYSGRDTNGNPTYNYLAIKYAQIELATNPREIINAWNYQVANWLRYYVYERVLEGQKKNQAKATFLTFMVSAVWHGFYPGYYVYFGLIHVFLEVSRDARKMFHFIPGKFSHVIGWVCTHTIANSLFPFFTLNKGDD